MKFFALFFALFLASCGQQPMNDIVISTDGIEGTWDKAVSDTRNEYDRTENRVEDTLKKTNMDVVDEEHRFNDRVKDTSKKANMDTLDTLAKANSDAVDEEHRFNDRFKTTTKKANMDAVAEGDKLTDRIVGSDDKTVDNHGDRIRDLERRVALIEDLNRSQDAMLALYLQQMQAGDAKLAKDLFDLRTDLSALETRVAESESDIGVLEVFADDINLRLEALTDEVGDIQAELLTIDSRLDTLETAVNSACTLTVGAKTNNLIPLGSKKATVTLQCLGKTPTSIADVLFR